MLFERHYALVLLACYCEASDFTTVVKACKFFLAKALVEDVF